MEILNYFYENLPEFSKFITRKYNITHPKTLIYGQNFAGKTMIISDFLANKSDILYIDFSLMKFDFNEFFFINLENFIIKNDIKYLVFDHFNKEFIKYTNFNFAVDFFIISIDEDLDILNFKKLKINPLSFEEFILFNKKNSDINSIFSIFLQNGNMPINANLTHFEAIKNIQNILKINLSKNEIEVLKQSSNFLHKCVSINKIYKDLKVNFKISKDFTYDTFLKLSRKKIIYLIKNYENLNGQKRLYFGDFLMYDVLNNKKDFKKKLCNVVFCELLNLKVEIFYTKFLDFYIKSMNLGILVIPFSSKELILLKFKSIFKELELLKITNLIVVTISSNEEFKLNKIKCKILPFSEFVLGL